MNEIIKSTINSHLLGLLGTHELVDIWWHSENKEFQYKTPDSIYQEDWKGRQRVYDYVLKHSYAET